MFSETVSGILSAVEIYEKRATIAQMVTRFAKYLVDGTAQVLVFGVGGTGKSTLGGFVQGKLDTDTKIHNYLETIQIDEFKMKGETSAILIIPPGQEARRLFNWDQLYQMLARGDATRVINVVSWGRHTSSLEKEAHVVHRTGQTDDQFREAYFANGKEIELQALKEMVPHLNSSPHKIKFVTLVTKQDLWWDERRDVKEFYTRGEYSKILDAVLSHKGAASFSHEYISCALVQQNLRMGDGFELALTASGYDDALRVTNLEMAAAALNGLVST